MESREVDTERHRRQVDVIPIAMWICGIAAGFLTALDIAQGEFSVRVASGRIAIFALFLFMDFAVRRGSLQSNVAATFIVASALGYCVLVATRGRAVDAGLFPLVVAIAPVVIPLRLRVAVVIIALATLAYVATLLSITAPPHSELRYALMGTSFGLLMSWLSERSLLQTVTRRTALRAESSRLALDSEHERLARDLHDHIGARLTAIALRAERDRSRLPEAATPTMRWIQSSAHLCLEELRDTIWGLSAADRDAGELLAILRRRAEDVATEAGLELRWQATAPSWNGSLSAGVGVALSAILREALTNIVRHSEASAVDISLSRDESSLTLEVTDNGRGLSTANPDGRGLSNMRSRALEQQGETQIENGTLGGVRVFARLPLGASSQHRITT